MSYRVALVIPCFNHADPLKGLLTKLADLNLPAYLVDDGSAPSEQEKINRLLPDFPFVRLVRRQENGGKGAAVIDGALAAQKDSFTHILQIDADGQHDTADIPTLLALSKEHPDTLISGFPLYDDSVPKGRLIGRYITHFWVWAETLSSTIVDSMCGFRVYPLVPLLSIVQNDKPGRHMDFDPEILVRLYWAGVPMKFIPTRVIYPKGGTSNFDAVHDNWRITKMHTKLFCKSVLLWPQLIGRNRLRIGRSLKSDAVYSACSFFWPFIGFSEDAFSTLCFSRRFLFFGLSPKSSGRPPRTTLQGFAPTQTETPSRLRDP